MTCCQVHGTASNKSSIMHRKQSCTDAYACTCRCGEGCTTRQPGILGQLGNGPFVCVQLLCNVQVCNEHAGEFLASYMSVLAKPYLRLPPPIVHPKPRMGQVQGSVCCALHQVSAIRTMPGPGVQHAEHSKSTSIGMCLAEGDGAATCRSCCPEVGGKQQGLWCSAVSSEPSQHQSLLEALPPHQGCPAACSSRCFMMRRSAWASGCLWRSWS